MKEILNKPVLKQQDIEYIVEQYILVKTGRTVKIVIDFIDPFWYQFQMDKLFTCFGHAYCYFYGLEENL